MSVTDSGRFKAVLSTINGLKVTRGPSRALELIGEQLEYLIEYEEGRVDGDLLGNLNFGVIAAKELDTSHPDLAMELYWISSEVERLAAERWNARSLI